MGSVPDNPEVGDSVGGAKADATNWAKRVPWYRIGADIATNNLRQCHGLVEDFLTKAASDFGKQVELQAAALPAEDRDEFYEFHSDQHWQLSTSFPETLRSSLFKTAYALLEDTLNDVCRWVQSRRSYAVSVLDMNGKGIKRAKLYLEKDAQVSFPARSQLWNQMVTLGKIRNIFAHAGGIVPSGDTGSPVRAFAKAHPDLLNIDGHDNLTLSGEFVPFALNAITAFLEELYAGLEDPGPASAPSSVSPA